MLYKYIDALNDKSAEIGDKEKDNCYYAMKEYSNYISIPKIEELETKISGDKNKAQRKISFKKLFFSFLFSLNEEKKIYRLKLGN